MATLESLVDRFAKLALKVSQGRRGEDFCVKDPDSDSDWLTTPLEKDLCEAAEALSKALESKPDLDGPGVTRIVAGLQRAAPARGSRRADVGFGYMDFDSLCNGGLWDLRYRLKDAVDALRAEGVDALAGADRAVLEANNGEFLTLLGAPREESNRAELRFTLDRLARLAKGVDPGKPEESACASEVAECLRSLAHRLDWDVLEPTRRHYSDSGYAPSTYTCGRPNPDNALWFFEAAHLDEILRALVACAPLVASGAKKNSPRCWTVRRQAAALASAIKGSLGEMKKVGRDVLAQADPMLLGAKKTGFKRSYGAFFEDRKPGELE